MISCAFGAVVMLILLAKNGEQDEYRDVANIAELISAIGQAQNINQKIGGELDGASAMLAELRGKNEQAQIDKKSLEAEVKRAKDNVEELNDRAEGLSLVKASQTRAATRAKTKPKKRDESVGGIPVDSEYVIFIIDTSGSMRGIWARVIAEMDKILDIHPKVKGFQVMNDNGHYLFSNRRGHWLKDSTTQRKSVLNQMEGWYSSSNSSPVEGLEEALKTYAKPGISLAIYILGDEYNGGSYDPVIASLNQLNTNRTTGKRIARVHGIGFVSGASTSRFSTLMREVAKQNRGTFLALPR